MLSLKILIKMFVVVKRQSNVFQDPTDEINELTGRIQYDTKTLTSELDDLELFLQHNRKQVGAEGHSENILVNMKEQLFGEVNNFKNILEVRITAFYFDYFNVYFHSLQQRQNKVKVERDRKNLFGRAQANALGRPFQPRQRHLKK